MAVCSVHWCIALAKPGDHVCAQHRLVPALNSIENQHEYFKRLRALRATAKREEAEAADQETAS